MSNPNVVKLCGFRSWFFKATHWPIYRQRNQKERKTPKNNGKRK